MSSHSDAKTIVALVPHNPSNNDKKSKERGKNRGHRLAPSKLPPGACSRQGALLGATAWQKNRPKWPPPGGTKLAAMVLENNEAQTT